MTVPKGFIDLVKIAMKEQPDKPKDTKDVWEKFLRVALMGGKRSDPEVSFLLKLLKNYLDMDYLLKKDGEDWRDEVSALIDERTSRIKDEDALVMLGIFKKEIFRICASLKGAARFFDKEKISPEKLSELLDTKEKARAFVDDLAGNEDVTNIKYTKVIIWLHSIGYGYDLAPPSYQTKAFINEIYGYYQFYEDDKYFMKKMEEFAEEVKKEEKKATVRDVSSAVFYYITLKSMLPQRSKEKKNFTPPVMVKFIKAKKLTLRKMSEMLSDAEDREKLIQTLYDYLLK